MNAGSLLFPRGAFDLVRCALAMNLPIGSLGKMHLHPHRREAARCARERSDVSPIDSADIRYC
jgi:hypothetical protein